MYAQQQTFLSMTFWKSGQSLGGGAILEHAVLDRRESHEGLTQPDLGRRLIHSRPAE